MQMVSAIKKAGVSSILFVVILLAVAVTTEAQQPKKVPRIGYLSSQDSARDSARSEAMRRALHELGYIEGQNIAIEYRYGCAVNNTDLLERIMAFVTLLDKLQSVD